MTENEIHRTRHVHVSIISPVNNQEDQAISSDELPSFGLENLEDSQQPTTPMGFATKTFFRLRSLISSPNKPTLTPNVSTRPILQRQFRDLFNDPISEHHERLFKNYFKEDLSNKTFTDNEFCRLFQVGPVLGKRLLIVFDQNQAYQTNSIPGSHIIRIARLLWNAPVSVKAFILFKVFDTNDDNRVSVDEIRLFYENYLKSLKDPNIFINEKRLTEVVDIFLEGFFPITDDIQQEELNFDQFYDVLQRNPDVFKSLYLIGIPDQDKEDEKEMTWYQRSWMYFKNNTNRIVFLISYFLILIALIIYRAISIKDQTAWQIIARIGGISINFNFAILITLMLKHMMTIIRRIYYLRLLIPVDDHIDAHRLVGTVLFISAIIHTIAYIIYFATHTEKHSWAASMFTTAAELGWVHYSAPITGDILVVLLIIIFIFALQCVRQRPGFYRLFHYTHLLFWPIYILLVIHAKDFWKWTVAPVSLFVLEKIYLLKRYLPNHGRTRLIAVRIEDENVITLIIEKPENFTFRPGEYINICLPNIGWIEWHPFTLSCAPEQDHLRVNIMKKKNWTKKVYEHFYKRLTNGDNITDLAAVTTDNSKASNIAQPREIKFTGEEKDSIICIEGPFSTCTSYLFHCEHVVLIGGGIGITPFISALESLIEQLKQQRLFCTECGASNYHLEKLKSRKLKKIDFIWINRDMKNFSWFQKILAEFEEEQDRYLNAIRSHSNNSEEQQARYLDIHLYCTSLRSNEEAMLNNLPYELVTNMYAAIRQHDIHTELRTRTQVGRPLWKLLFAKFKAEHKSTNVFFTGNAMMASEIKRYCDELGFPFRPEPGFS